MNTVIYSKSRNPVQTSMRFSAIAALCLSLAVPALAQDARSPETLVKEVTQEVLTALKTDKDLVAGDKKKTRELIEKKILPSTSFDPPRVASCA